MKISLSIIVCFLIVFAHGQEGTGLKVRLTGWHGDGRRLPQRLDTVFLNLTYSKTDKVYTSLLAKDTFFIIPGVPVGKYWLLFSTQEFCISPLPIVVCSKCDNQYSFFASPKKQGDNCNLFEMVEVSPIYIGGSKSLSKDFQRTLSRTEKKKLKAAGNFTVHFYLTKQGIISDPFFTPPVVPQEIKDIILKGLATVTNWRPAERNGTEADVEFSLDKPALLNH